MDCLVGGFAGCRLVHVHVISNVYIFIRNPYLSCGGIDLLQKKLSYSITENNNKWVRFLSDDGSLAWLESNNKEVI